jgi:hypothetical protein
VIRIDLPVPRHFNQQLLHNGARANVLGFRRISHLWARGVPGATYCRDIAEIYDALLHLGAEGRSPRHDLNRSSIRAPAGHRRL